MGKNPDDEDPLVSFIALGHSVGGGNDRSAAYTGTKALYLAVLEEAIRAYLSPADRVRSEAECWVVSGRNRSPFSFVTTCEVLNLAPESVRTALSRLRARYGNTGGRGVLSRSRPNVRRSQRLQGPRPTKPSGGKSKKLEKKPPKRKSSRRWLPAERRKYRRS